MKMMQKHLKNYYKLVILIIIQNFILAILEILNVCLHIYYHYQVKKVIINVKILIIIELDI